MNTKYEPSITVGDFKKLLDAFNDDMWLDFSMLDFYRLKQRSSDTIQVEFNQIISRDQEDNVVVQNIG